jgi:hypothetical protein
MKCGILFAGLTAVFMAAHPVLAEELAVGKGILDKDTTWSGEVLIKGDVEVAASATLTILPGTVVRFVKIAPFGPEKLHIDKENHFPGSEIFVKGKLIAQGEKDKKITFRSAEKDGKPGDWGGINFNSSTGNIVKHCVLLHADTAVHAHSSKVTVTDNEFKHNGTAVGNKNLKDNPVKCELLVEHNLITENGGGVIVGNGMNVQHNEITKNEFFGLYPKNCDAAPVCFNTVSGNGKGVILYAVKTITLTDNNIMDNTDYNLSMLEGQTADLAFPGNWWGTTDEQKIREKILDKEKDSVLGKADVSNFAQAAIAGAGI